MTATMPAATTVGSPETHGSPRLALGATPELRGPQNRVTGRKPLPHATRESECPECHARFAGHTAGDHHRIVVSTYDLLRNRATGELRRVASGERIDGWRVASSGNQIRRCLTSDEMTAKGWRQDDLDRWKQPGTWKPDTDPTLESETP